MSRATNRFGTKRSAKVNYGAPAGHNGKKALFSSWKGRKFGKSLRKNSN